MVLNITACDVAPSKFSTSIITSSVAVNIASRMESTGVPGRIHVSANTYELIKHKYPYSYMFDFSAVLV